MSPAVSFKTPRRLPCPAFRAPLLIALMLAAMPCSGRGEAARPQQEDQPTGFIRLHSPPEENPALQVAIASYRQPGSGIEVDLVGAVHVADAAYFDALNELFDGYDAVLFEMIGGRDGLTRTDTIGTGSPVNRLQKVIQSVLDLEFQLEAIDYARDNFFHADMSAEDFAREQRKRKEGMLALLLRAANEEERLKQSKPGSVPELNVAQLLRIALSPSRSDELKYLFARELIASELLVEALEKDGETVIVSGRNRVAMEKLEEVTATGKHRIAIFYGAAHLPGMERLLLEENNFVRSGHRWITAWDIQLKKRRSRSEKTKPTTPASQPRNDAEPALSPSS